MITTNNKINADIVLVQSIKALPAILRAVAETTGLGFVCVARVTDDSWTTCSVLDNLGFGLKPGDELDVATTLCREVRACNAPVIIDHVDEDATYHDHLTPKMYGFKSYVSIPLYRANGEFFGTLCGLDRNPKEVSNEKIQSLMRHFTEMISLQLEAEQRYDENALALTNERKTAELREQFIAVLGHDLRTPLSAILTGTSILLTGSLEARQRSVILSMQRSGQRISRLVDDVLDFARGRMGEGITLEVVETPTLANDLQQVIDELRGASAHRRINWKLMPLGTIVCSPDRLSQLLSNLLTNAIHYSPVDTPVNVEARVLNSEFVLSVKNQGPAIPPETISHLFQPYWRAASKKPDAGLGLGLYIAAEIARAHKGKLEVTSGNELTVFTFTMPVCPPFFWN
jgi:signal transduction histidine kinase